MPSNQTIFPPWHFDHWRAVDDRVRGGSSISHLDKVDLKVQNPVKGEEETGARFWGNLDISTLGGAGFASQSYRYGPSPLRLPSLSYSGISISYLPDPKTHYTEKTPRDYTFVLKTTPTANIPKHPKTPGPPREAQLTYEVTFSLPHSSEEREEKREFRWNEFQATYRGRKIPEGDERWVPLDPGLIYELSIMCRSDFGKQHGDFGVVVTSIEAIRKETDVGLWSRLKGLWNWVVGLFGWSRGGVRLADEVNDEEKRLIA
ncbi:hypothetical protein I302_104078 [Kwoniella bestiolae CBS 10118]|uniref:NADH:ubiquinone oxidoreductase intermediate-associated protein 30 domain-containing protein n=1 Tax=Kwoniella bestiolae CBS 10118 TaxID=1296100 RepID=A0A1B9GA82_9TREE|nr:hypothetical protein I302_02783 [Kwoniella bestiolae CBS 10118]OCF27933.1 hypothetical protein I302_02783 [Kwoniella bestiolae CBS 10118]